MTFTTLEKQVIAKFNVAFNYRNAEDEISDNATAIAPIDIAEEIDLSLATVVGVFGSLTKKGLLREWHEIGANVSHITEDGIRAHYNLKS